jgi:hypothetical protein
MKLLKTTRIHKVSKKRKELFPILPTPEEPKKFREKEDTPEIPIYETEWNNACRER